MWLGCLLACLWPLAHPTDLRRAAIQTVSNPPRGARRAISSGIWNSAGIQRRGVGPTAPPRAGPVTCGRPDDRRGGACVNCTGTAAAAEWHSMPPFIYRRELCSSRPVHAARRGAGQCTPRTIITSGIHLHIPRARETFNVSSGWSPAWMYVR